MQITRETIQLDTKFVFDSDSCEGCGGKYGYDLFIFDSGIAISGIVKGGDEARSKELIKEFSELVSQTSEEYDKKTISEQNAILERTDAIMQKLSEMGIELTRPEFHLLVYYGDNNIEVAGAEINDVSGKAYVKLMMIEELPDSIRYAQLFQGTCAGTENINQIYDMCICGISNEIVTKEEIESGEPLPFNHHDN